MKTLQSDLTTSVQSKRLLELGVPADSANYYYQDYGSIPMVVWTLTQPRDLRRGILKPCWSVGRLIEIFEICTGLVWQNEVIDGYTKIDMLLEDFEDVEKKYMFDFSKLDE